MENRDKAGPFANRTHGNVRTYNRGCRCEPCKEAGSLYVRKGIDARKGRLEAGQVRIRHGASGYTNWGCRCEICTQANAEKCRKNVERRKAVDDWKPSGWPSRDPELASIRNARENAETLKAAKRHGYVWTGPELEVAARPDLTSKEVARLLGRSLSAVKSIRARLKRDPKTIELAGLRPQRQEQS